MLREVLSLILWLCAESAEARMHQDDYQRRRKFVEYFASRMEGIDQTPEHERPMAVLETLEKRSRSVAVKAVNTAISDFVVSTESLAGTALKRVDEELVSIGSITLSEARIITSKRERSIINRGHIRNDSEFEIMKNYLDLLPESQAGIKEEVIRLIANYEGT